MVLSVGCQAGESGQNITPTPGESAEQASIPKLTPKNYEAIREGMTRQQVEEILGPGEEISTAELEAISGPDKEVGSYLWTEDLNLVTIIFEDNRVVTKDKSGF